MSDLDRLHEIIDTLPEPQVHALLTLLAPNPSTMKRSPAAWLRLPKKKKSTERPLPEFSALKPKQERSSLTAN